LLVDNPLVVLNDMTVAAGGVVTHSGYPLNNGTGLQLNIGQRLEVLPGGKIDVSRVGLRGAYSSGRGSTPEAYNAAGQLIDGPNENHWGGSHGGIGGGSNEGWVYEQIENPTLLGSGGHRGGTQNGCCVSAGGNGGGLVRIVAPTATVVIDGDILANGQQGDWQSPNNLNTGGGAGGSIFIQADAITGGGNIRADGGTGGVVASRGWYGGSGGGGRVALLYNQLTLPANNITARNGGSAWPGSAGTVFLRPSATDPAVPGDLIVDNGNSASGHDTPLRTGLTTIRSLTLRQSSRTLMAAGDLPSPFTLQTPLNLTGPVTWSTRGVWTLAIPNDTGFDLTATSGATVVNEH